VGPYPRPVSRHTYDELAIVNGELIVLAYQNGGNSVSIAQFNMGGDPLFTNARAAHYKFSTGVWTFSDTAHGDTFPFSGAPTYPGTEVDPVSQKVLMLSPNGLSVYDPVTKTKTRVIRGDSNEFKNANGETMNHSVLDMQMYYERSLVYSIINDRFYYLNPPYVFELNFNRVNPAESTLTLVASAGVSAIAGAGRTFDYDSKNHMIVGGFNGNQVKIFNPLAYTWSEQTVAGGAPGDAAHHVWKYDIINNVFFFQGHESDNFWAYRYK